MSPPMRGERLGLALRVAWIGVKLIVLLLLLDAGGTIVLYQNY